MTSSECRRAQDVLRNNADFFTRPANILLSDDDIPVLVDFGFAEKYELGSSKAFRSNLAYGTPEVNHDTFTHIRVELISPILVPFTRTCPWSSPRHAQV